MDLNEGYITLNVENPGRTFPFTVVNDSIYEIQENLSASLGVGAVENQVPVMFDPSLTEIFIIDDDGKFE